MYVCNLAIYYTLYGLLSEINSYICFNPLRLQYVLLRTKSQNRCDSCTYIYVHRLCDRNMGLLPASNRHFTVSPHEVFTCFGLQMAAILQHVYQRKKSGVYSELSAVFGEFWKITIDGPSSIHRFAWNTGRIIWIFCRESEVSG